VTNIKRKDLDSPRLREIRSDEFSKIATVNVDDTDSTQVMHVRKRHNDEMDKTKHALLKAEVSDHLLLNNLN